MAWYGVEAGVGQRRGRDGVCVPERDEVARGHDDVLGHAAVLAQAGAHVRHVDDVLAVGVLAAGAGAAVLAADRAVDDVGGSDLEALDPGPELLDPPRDLVSEDVRRGQGIGGVGVVFMEEGNVGVAGTRTRDLQQHLARPWGGLLELPELGECVKSGENNALHRASPSTWVSEQRRAGPQIVWRAR